VSREKLRSVGGGDFRKKEGEEYIQRRGKVIGRGKTSVNSSLKNKRKKAQRQATGKKSSRTRGRGAWWTVKDRMSRERTTVI